MNLVEVSNKQGYSLWAETYDSEKNPLIAVEEPHVDNILKTIPYSHILDAGTGTGRNALRLAGKGISITAIDQSSEMLGIAEKKALVAKRDIKFVSGSLDTILPFENNSFNLVLCSLALTHIPDINSVVKEFYRICCKDGYLLITDFHPESVKKGFRTEFKVQDTLYQLPNIMYSREDYIQAVSIAGFKIEQIEDIPGNEIPQGYVSDELLETNTNVGLCLIILAKKTLNPDADR